MYEMELLRARVKQAGGSFRKCRNSNYHATVKFGSKKYASHISILSRILFSYDEDAIAWRLKQELI